MTHNASFGSGAITPFHRLRQLECPIKDPTARSETLLEISMTFIETKLNGAYVIEIQKLEDTRGFFARTWCKNEFERHGLISHLMQANISFSNKKGTLRGMHYQIAPNQESKLVRCTKGANPLAWCRRANGQRIALDQLMDHMENPACSGTPTLFLQADQALARSLTRYRHWCRAP